MAMWRTKQNLLLGAAALVVAGLVAWGPFRSHAEHASAVDDIALLVPDSTDMTDPMVMLWLDAGSEEGFHVIAIRDSDFLRSSMGGPRWKGAILPDTVHQCASDVLVGGLTRYVEQGGSLMLVGDAGVLNQNKVYPQASSRFSQLAGVEYAFYNELREKAYPWGPVWGDKNVLGELGIPPGAAIPRTEISSSSSQTGAGGTAGDSLKFARYGGETLLYPGFVTRGVYDGRVLLQSTSGVAAGVRNVRQGNVLYVNLPLGYLKSRTDGLLLHAFLRYFAKDLLRLPSLTAVPDGIGGMVLNWHLDSNAALAPLDKIRKAGIFEQGPYSIHLTAGPDTREFGDGLGLNVNGDPEIQNWIRYFVRHGHAVGSHGGWIHDYFGLNVSDNNQPEFEKFLILNKASLERVMQGPVREYSAPVGTQPQWVTLWLQQHGIHAYYFTGNASMAPTQTYRDGTKADTEGWSFPISHLGRMASFEEISEAKIPDAEVLQWLDDLSNFCSEQRTVRLFYSHPPGVVPYLGLMQAWMKKTGKLSGEGKFRWYTMSQLADFLNQRKAVNWNITMTDSGRHRLTAQSPTSLVHMTWMVPATVYGQPRVLEGAALVQRQRQDWFIVAQDGTTKITVELPLLSPSESERQQ